MPMRIDFLRARLISERSASKAAKQQIQDLGTKVSVRVRSICLWMKKLHKNLVFWWYDLSFAYLYICTSSRIYCDLFPCNE